jgi:hypothetical protein
MLCSGGKLGWGETKVCRRSWLGGKKERKEGGNLWLYSISSDANSLASRVRKPFVDAVRRLVVSRKQWTMELGGWDAEIGPLWRVGTERIDVRLQGPPISLYRDPSKITQNA